MQFFDTGYTYITDMDGMVIGYNKVPDLVGVMNISQPTIPQFNDEPIDPALNKLFADAMSSNAQASGTWKMPDGTSFFSVATPFDVEGTQWCVISAAPTSEVAAPAHQLLVTMAVIALIVLVLAVVILTVFSQRMTAPLGVLLAECRRINGGDLRDQELGITSADEIGQLANGFKDMRQQLHSLLANVQDQAQQVAAASEELTASSEQSAQASNQVAESITNIAGGVEDQATASQNIQESAAGVTQQCADGAHRRLGAGRQRPGDVGPQLHQRSRRADAADHEEHGKHPGLHRQAQRERQEDFADGRRHLRHHGADEPSRAERRHRSGTRWKRRTNPC